MSVANLLKSEIPTYTTILPISKKEIKYRPYVVREEKVLLLALQEGTENAIFNGIKTLIQSCVEGIEDAGELSIADLEYTFLHLRSKSVGEKFNPTTKCIHTDKNVQLQINIEDIKLSNEVPDNRIEIEKNVGITMNMPSVNILNKTNMEAINDLDKNIEEFFELLGYCIEEIWSGDEIFIAKDLPQKEIIEFIESMTVVQFDKVLEFFKTIPKLQCKTTYKVPYGKEKQEGQPDEEEVVLEGFYDFFV